MDGEIEAQKNRVTFLNQREEVEPSLELRALDLTAGRLSSTRSFLFIYCELGAFLTNLNLLWLCSRYTFIFLAYIMKIYLPKDF